MTETSLSYTLSYQNRNLYLYYIQPSHSCPHLEKGLQRLEQKFRTDNLTKEKLNNRGYNRFLSLEGKAKIRIDYDKVETAYTIMLELERILKAAGSKITVDRARFLAENIYQLNYVNMFDGKEMSFRIPDKEYGDEVNELLNIVNTSSLKNFLHMHWRKRERGETN